MILIPLAPLPPLGPLPPLPPLPALAPLPVPFEPETPPLKLTDWFPLSVWPVHAGKYEIGEQDERPVLYPCGKYLWDGREWADKLPPGASAWRGVDRGRWVNYLEASPKQSGWYRMRHPKGEKSAPSYYAAEGNGMRTGWYWMDTAGELKAYACHPRWAAEWWHDGAEA